MGEDKGQLWTLPRTSARIPPDPLSPMRKGEYPRAPLASAAPFVHAKGGINRRSFL